MQPSAFPIESVFVFGDGRTVFVVSDSTPERKLIDKSTWAVKRADSDEIVMHVEIESEMLKRGRAGERTLVTLDQLTFDKSAVDSATWTLHRSGNPAEATDQSRYWDYPFENCMVRETRTAGVLEIGIKFYGKDEWIVDLTHEIYREVLCGGGTATDIKSYERGKKPPERTIYQARSRSVD